MHWREVAEDKGRWRKIYFFKAEPRKRRKKVFCEHFDTLYLRIIITNHFSK